MSLKTVPNQLLLKRLSQLRKVTRPWLKNSFQQQIDFINDKSPLVGALCTRRAGKSYGVGIKLCKTAWENPGSSVVYIALTRDSAKRIMWKDILKRLNHDLNLNARFNETTLTMIFPNGSELSLVGTDSRAEEMQKLLGQKFALAVIDEGSMYRIDLKQLVYSMLKPAVADYNGQIVIIGTPGNNTKSLFYDITTGAEPGWSLHKWSAYDNTHMRAQWDKELAFLREKNPGIEETPIFKQMYLGQWVIDLDALIYRYDLSKNFIEELPKGENWTYILGIDLGYTDATAFTMAAFNEHDPTLYFVDCFQQSGLHLTDVADHVRRFQEKYRPAFMIIDNASKQAVEELVYRYHFPFIPTEKLNKYEFIQLMNTDLYTGHIKLLPRCADLKKEWDALVWDERQLDFGKHVEHPALPNHLSDAALYAWRYAYHYTSKPKTIDPDWDPASEFWEKEALKIEQRQHDESENFYGY